MALVRQMLIPLTLIIIVMNSMVLAMTFLPSNQAATLSYSFGLTEENLSDLNSTFNSIEEDSDQVSSDLNTTVSSSDTEKTTLNILDTILLGIGEAAQTVLGGIGSTFGLVGDFIKYVLFMVFGYWFWIDYFFNPVIGVSGVGSFALIFSQGIKSIFLLIQITGLISYILPIFTGGRQT